MISVMCVLPVRAPEASGRRGVTWLDLRVADAVTDDAALAPARLPILGARTMKERNPALGWRVLVLYHRAPVTSESRRYPSSRAIPITLTDP